MAAKKKKTTNSVKKTSPVKTTTIKKRNASVKISSPKPKTVKIPPMDSMEIEQQTHDTQKQSGFSFKRRHFYSIAVIIVIIALLYIFRSQFVVATVNGQPLSRTAYNAELEKRAGKSSMDSLVTQMLIQQEADKKNITVSDSDVNNQIKQDQQILSKQGQNLNSYLTMQGMTMDDFKQQTKINLLVQKLLGDKIKVTDKEISDELAKEQQQAQQDTSGTPAPTPSKDQIKQQLEQQKINQQVPAWIQNLQKNAKITYFIPQ